MAARKSGRVNRKYKTKRRVTNWQEYERGLRSRGDITVWFSDEASSGSQGIVDRADRAPSRIFSSGTSARSKTAFVRAATSHRSGRQGSGAMQ